MMVGTGQQGWKTPRRVRVNLPPALASTGACAGVRDRELTPVYSRTGSGIPSVIYACVQSPRRALLS